MDGQICHTMVQYGDSTVYYSRIGDRHLTYPGKLRSECLSMFCQALPRGSQRS